MTQILAKTDIDRLRSARYSELGDLAAKPNWMLLGDSHADALQDAFSQLLLKNGASALVGTEAGCPPALNLWRHDMDYKTKCHDNYSDVIKIIRQKNIEHVLVAARFALYLNSSRFDNSVGGIEKGATDAVIYDHIDFKDTVRNLTDRAGAIEDELVNFAKLLAETGADIYIFSSLPEFGWDVPSRLSRGQPTNIPRDVYDKRMKPLAPLYERLSRIKNVSILNTEQLFCDQQMCRSASDDMPLFYDSNHPSIFGAQMLLEQFEQDLMNGKH